MASKLSFLNPLKERKKANNKDGTKDDDELAMVKAAAWAWHQHGSSNIIEGTSEFDVTRKTISNNRRATTRPSRYKLEAAVTNMAKEVAKEDQEKGGPLHEASNMWSLERVDVRSFIPTSGETVSRAKEEEGSPLIHNKKELSLLDSYEVQSISRHLDRLLESNNHHNNSANESRDVDVGGRKTKKKKKNMRKGFLLRHGAICGREEDVVDPSRRPIGKD